VIDIEGLAGHCTYYSTEYVCIDPVPRGHWRSWRSTKKMGLQIGNRKWLGNRSGIEFRWVPCSWGW